MVKTYSLTGKSKPSFWPFFFLLNKVCRLGQGLSSETVSHSYRFIERPWAWRGFKDTQRPVLVMFSISQTAHSATLCNTPSRHLRGKGVPWPTPPARQGEQGLFWPGHVVTLMMGHLPLQGPSSGASACWCAPPLWPQPRSAVVQLHSPGRPPPHSQGLRGGNFSLTESKSVELDYERSPGT